MNFLIISDLVDIKEKKVTHYSLDKGINFGIGLKNNGCKVDYVVSVQSYSEDGINYICYTELTSTKIDSYDYVILVREGLIEQLMEIFNELSQVFLNEKRKTKIIIKSDSCGWIINKDFRNYIGKQFKINCSTGSIVKWVNRNIYVVCVQNEEYLKLGIELGVDSHRMIISNMAVPYEIIDYSNLVDTNLFDYSRCKKKKYLTRGDSLYPANFENLPDEFNNWQKKKRTKILYMGRIKTDGGRIALLMRDIMKELDDYELHIFPGSFIMFNEEISKIESFSSNNSNHLEILRDRIFKESPNIFIHCPFEHRDIKKYLWNVDMGIDFSSSRPNNIKANAGNAKLLEYCYLGLPVITETNVNNSHLVTQCSNGILLDGIATVNDYVNAIKNINNLQIDRIKSSQITIENENWNLRTKNFIESLKKLL